MFSSVSKVLAFVLSLFVEVLITPGRFKPGAVLICPRYYEVSLTTSFPLVSAISQTWQLCF